MNQTTTVAQILEALQPIVDPDLGKSIVDLGFVKHVVIDGARVSFTIELTTPACPVKAEFEREARGRVLALEGIEDVEVEMSAATRGRAVAAAISRRTASWRTISTSTPRSGPSTSCSSTSRGTISDGCVSTGRST